MKAKKDLAKKCVMWFYPAEIKLVKAKAKELGVSESEVMRRAIREFAG